MALTFQGTHRPVADKRTTLFLGLEHPQVQVRLMALEQVATLLESEDTEESSDFLVEAVLQRLRDDDPAVVKRALSVPALSRAPSAPLLAALEPLLHHPLAAIEHSAALLISTSVAPRHPRQGDIVASLGHILLPGQPGAEDILTALSAAPGLFHGVAKALKGNESDRLARALRHAGRQLNSSVQSAGETLTETLKAMAVTPAGERVALLVVCAALQLDTTAAVATAAAALDLVSLTTDVELKVVDALLGNAIHGELPPATLLQPLLSKPSEEARMALMLFTLGNIVSVVPGLAKEDILFSDPTAPLTDREQVLSATFEQLANSSLYRSTSGSKVLKKLLKRHVTTQVVRFASHFWQSERNPLVQQRAVHLVTAAVLAGGESRDWHSILPTLWSALILGTHSVRQAVIDCLGAFPSGTQRWAIDPSQPDLPHLPPSLASQVIERMRERAEELIVDGTFLPRVLQPLWTAWDPIDRQRVEEWWVSYAWAFPVRRATFALLTCLQPLSGAASLRASLPELQRLRQVLSLRRSAETLLKVKPDPEPVADAMDREKESEEEDEEEDEEDNEEMQVEEQEVAEEQAAMLLGAVSPAALAVLAAESAEWREMVEWLRRPFGLATSALLGQLSAPLFLGLPPGHQKTLWGLLCDLLFAPSPLNEQAKELLAAMPVDAAIVAERLVLPTTFTPVNTRSRLKRRKTSSPGDRYKPLLSHSSLDDDEEPDFTLAFAKLESILELLQYKENISRAESLIPLLFQMLDQVIRANYSALFGKFTTD